MLIHHSGGSPAAPVELCVVQALHVAATALHGCSRRLLWLLACCAVLGLQLCSDSVDRVSQAANLILYRLCCASMYTSSKECGTLSGMEPQVGAGWPFSCTQLPGGVAVAVTSPESYLVRRASG